MKGLFKIIKWVIGAVIALIIISILLSILFRQKIETAALTQLDKITNNQLQYGEANFNYINSFPSISLDLSNPTFYDNNYDAALELEEFQVRLNIFKSIFSDPVISRLVIKNGSVTLKERNQKWNIEDLMTGSGAPSENTGLINIDELIVENFKVVVDRGTADQITQFTLVDATMEMSSDNQQVNIFAQGLVSFDYVINDSDHQLIDINDSFQADLNYNKSSKIVTIAPSQLDQGLTLEGWFNTLNSKRDIRLDIRNWDINKLNTWLSESETDVEKQLRVDGKLTGLISFDDISAIDYTLYIKNGEVIRGDEHQLVLSDIQSTLTGNQEELSFKQLELEVDDEKLVAEVNYSVTNNMLTFLRVNGNVPAKSLHTLSRDSSFHDIKGVVGLTSFVITNYPLESEQSVLNYVKLEGDIKHIKLNSNTGKELHIKEGNVKNIGEEFHFDHLQVEMDNSEFEINGHYVIEENRNVIKCSINGDKIQATDLLSFNNSTDTTTTQSNFLADNRFYLTLDVDKLWFNKIKMGKVKAKLTSINDVLKTNFEGRVFEGDVKSEGRLEFENGNYHYHFSIDGKNIDLEECLDQNENFGQEVISSDNLKGDLNTLSTFDFYYDKEWNLLPTKTKGLISGEISNGRIQDLEMMTQFSKFVNIKDLEEIKFTEINNYLEIKGKNLYIPTMFIQSNAANFTLSGYHSIENVQLYFLKVNAGQILANKFKKHDPTKPPKPDRRNGMFNMHYVVNGTSESYEYKRDRSRVKAAFKNGEERKRLIYNELVREFGQNERLRFEEIQ